MPWVAVISPGLHSSAGVRLASADADTRSPGRVAMRSGVKSSTGPCAGASEQALYLISARRESRPDMAAPRCPFERRDRTPPVASRARRTAPGYFRGRMVSDGISRVGCMVGSPGIDKRRRQFLARRDGHGARSGGACGEGCLISNGPLPALADGRPAKQVRKLLSRLRCSPQHPTDRNVATFAFGSHKVSRMSLARWRSRFTPSAPRTIWRDACASASRTLCRSGQPCWRTNCTPAT